MLFSDDGTFGLTFIELAGENAEGVYATSAIPPESQARTDFDAAYQAAYGDEAGELATFTAVQTQIFSASCAFSGCHGGGSSSAGLNLQQGQAYDNIVDVPSTQQGSLDRIEPNDPDSSYLYLKVIGDASITGSRMPRGGPALDQELIDLLRDWIERGAPND